MKLVTDMHAKGNGYRNSYSWRSINCFIVDRPQFCELVGLSGSGYVVSVVDIARGYSDSRKQECP